VPPGALRSEVDAIAAKSGVHAGGVYTVDAAQRTTGANAYVTGFGGTKRVVIYDTLLHDFTPAERRQVVAHEFGHAKHRDLLAGLIWFAFVATASLFAVDLFARVLAKRRGVELASPAGIAMIAAAAMIAVALSQPAANAYSRRIEARADAFGLRVTQNPQAAIALERQLTIKNLARPEPPATLQWLFGTHPAPMQRIGMAETVRREQAAGKVEAAP
jgi:STE24 endopeptidase